MNPFARILTATIACGVPALLILYFIIGTDGSTIVRFSIGVVLILVVILLVGVLCCKYLDKRPFSDLGFKVCL
jgi:uncharacterized membrane protein YidH (DUF202 family)